MFTEETPNQLHSQTSKLTRDILSYSSDVVMAKSNTRKHSIYNKAKQSNSPSSHSNVSSPLFQISASVIKESGVNGMDIVWDEVEERKTTKDRIEERHQRFFHNVVKERLHKSKDKARST